MQLSILVKLNAGIDLFKQYLNTVVSIADADGFYRIHIEISNCAYRCFADPSNNS